jgi:hypothetical protein
MMLAGSSLVWTVNACPVNCGRRPFCRQGTKTNVAAGSYFATFQ